MAALTNADAFVFMPDTAMCSYTDAEASTHDGRKCHSISKKGAVLIVRNSFIQMSKLTNLKGRINYIASPARQENLYAVYETTDRKFWRELARCNQEEFRKSGTSGTCIEARELIIALPESFVDYQPKLLLTLFTEHFKNHYGTECIAALHHNKRKTNYHIHLIFSERKLLDEPLQKVAGRNMFYDENGRHVRTKKEILDDAGQLRKGCRIIPKGEVYERTIFTTKDSRFKSENFLDEVKHSYTDLINIYVKEDKEKLKVFDRNGVYLPMKKVGKNNPKAEEIEADNEVRKRWNQTVDRALVSGVSEIQIMEVKKKEIGLKTRVSIEKTGRYPDLFKNVVVLAIVALELLINRIFQKALEKLPIVENRERRVAMAVRQEVIEDRKVLLPKTAKKTFNEKRVAKMPVKSLLASSFSKLSEIYSKLEQQNIAIYQREQQLIGLEKELADTKGIFKVKQRNDLQSKSGQLKSQIAGMKHYLSNIVQGYGYKSVKEFMIEYTTAKSEYNAYQKAVAEWKNQTGDKAEPDSIHARLEQKRQEVQKRENNKRSCHYKDVRGSR